MNKPILGILSKKIDSYTLLIGVLLVLISSTAGFLLGAHYISSNIEPIMGCFLEEGESF